jgi:NAD(P)H-hydrate epimerase
MKNVFFNEDILKVESEIIKELEIPSLLLMENAGYNSYKEISNILTKEKLQNIVLLCGKGNNAGDGFVIARHLISNGKSVNIFMFYPESSLKGDARINFTVLKKIIENGNNRSIFINENELILQLKKGRNLIIDSVFGIGFSGKLEENTRKLFKKIKKNKSHNVILALDTVSGLYIDNITDCFKADYTITMGSKKFITLFGETKKLSGSITTVNIGIPEKYFTKYNEKKIFEIEDDDIKGILPLRRTDSNKYSNGKLYIIAGSTGFTGAAHLSGEASLRIGCGAVILAVPAMLNPVFEAKTIEVVTHAVKDDNNGYFGMNSLIDIEEKLKWADTCLIGCGLGRNVETGKLIRKIVSENNIQFIIDGDGLFAFKNDLKILKKRSKKIILTPHLGEFSGLVNLDTKHILNDIYYISKNFAKEHNVILVLKGSPTIITDGNEFFINPTGKENLATFGTGDVLAGIISGVTAQIKNPLKSALYSVYLHGKCGDLLWNKCDNSSTIASDLLPKISEVKKFLAC